MADEGGAEFGDELGSEMVEIFVGNKKEPFGVHLKLLSQKAPYFQKMFSTGFKEAEERKANLPEDDTRVFNLFLEWLYRGSFRPLPMKPLILTRLNDQLMTYCFAEKICLSDLQDYTMTAILSNFKKANILPHWTMMAKVYRNTASGSPIRKFISLCYVRVLRFNDTAGWPTKDLSGVLENEEFRTDVLDLLRVDVQKNGSPLDLPPCIFHVHEGGAACPHSKVVL